MTTITDINTYYILLFLLIIHIKYSKHKIKLRNKFIFADHSNFWSEPGIELDTSSTALAYATTAPLRQSFLDFLITTIMVKQNLSVCVPSYIAALGRTNCRTEKNISYYSHTLTNLMVLVM